MPHQQPDTRIQPGTRNPRPGTEVSVVIPSYRSGETLEASVQSILKQQTRFRFQVLVVDSSGHETPARTLKNYPQVQLLSSPSRLFPGAARNLGAPRSTGRYLAFLDADARAEPGWLQTLHSKLERMPEARMISGAIANANPQSLSSWILYWIEFSEFVPGLPSGFRPFLSSSNLLIRREDFFSCGGFAEEYAMAEDLILSQRLAGGLYFAGSTHILHYHRSNWAAVKEHLYQVGYWSGRFRLHHRVSASWLRRAPLLSFSLPALRAARIIERIFRSNWKEGVKSLPKLPVLLLALTTWSAGFYEGLRSGTATSTPTDTSDQ